MLKHIKNISYITISQIILSTSIFLLNLIWAREFSTEDYGTYKLITSLLSIMAIFSLSGLNNTLIISSGKNIGQNFKIIYIWKFISGIVLSTLIFVFLTNLKVFSELPIYFTLTISIIFPFYVNNNNWKFYFQGNSEFRKFLNFTFFDFIAFLIIAYTYFIFNYSYLVFIITIILIRTINNNILNLSIIPKLNNKKNIDLLKDGLKYTPGFIFGILFYFEPYVVNEMMSTGDVARFSIITIIPLQLKSLYDISLKLISKKIVKNNFDNFWNWIKIYFKKICLGYFFLGLFGSLLLFVLFPIFFGSNYSEIAYISAAVFFLYSLSFPASYINSALFLQGQTKYHLKFQFLTSFSKLTLLIICIFYFKLDGIVIVFLFMTILNWLLMIIKFRRFYRGINQSLLEK